MASSSGYNNVGGAVQSISCKLQATDLPSKRLLGKGLASIVYETKWKGLRCARKDFMGVPSDIFEAEARTLVRLDHDNIVKTHGWTVDKMSCSLVVEYVEDDLLSLLQHRKRSRGTLAGTGLELQEAIEVMLQIARAIAYLHGQGIVHGDLKTNNIFVTQVKDTSKNSLQVKVADFGLIQTKRKSIPFVSRPVRKLDMVQWKGPEYFKRPLGHVSEDNDESSESDSSSNEVCTSGSSDVNNDGLQFQTCDSYSFALTCYQILTCKKPYPNWNWKALEAKVVQDDLRPKLPSSCPHLLVVLLEQCWDKNQRNRPPFIDICRMLEEIQVTISKSIDHPDLITRGLDDSSSVVIATKNLDISSSSKNFNIEINESPVEANTSSKGLMKIPHIKRLRSSDDIKTSTHLKRLHTDEFENYDVFISCHGLDTRVGFVSFLYDALRYAGLQPFLDCVSIDKGQDAWACIEHAIKTSPIAIVIFSENYAQSEWVLKELHVMMENPGVKVLPVFYKVEPWEVRFPEKGRLANGFAKLKQRQSVTCIDGWMENLERASKLNGWEYKEDERLGEDLVNEIAAKVFMLGNRSLPLDVGEHVFGVDRVAQEIIQRLDQKKSILMVGLLGLGGIGKTTLARELYNRLKMRFVVSSFIEDVKGKVIHGGITKVQSRILNDLCINGEEIKDKSWGKVVLEERLCTTKILLVLDDVSENDEMGYLISRKMLSKGSICIVTSRNTNLFQSFDVPHEVYIHDVQKLDYEVSRQIFTSCAFGADFVIDEDLKEVVVGIIKACGGLPLALQVCGGYLRDKDIDTWKVVLEKLMGGSISKEDMLFKRLKIIYDSLQPQQKEMFLDIACALLGQSKDLAIQVWRSQGWYAALDVQTLEQMALVKVNVDGCFSMHDVLRDMGQEIARREATERGNIRRLPEVESLKHLKDCGTLPKWLQTLVISEPFNDGMGYSPIQLDLSGLEDLRILRCWLNPASKFSLPKNLMWFSWIQEPSGHETTSFPPIPQGSKLVILDLKGSHYKTLCESIENASKLEVLNLSRIKSLRRLPNSFGALGALRTLNLMNSGIECLPRFFGSLSSLENLVMSWCTELKELPESFGSLGTLRTLNLTGSGIECLPKSFGSLSSLKNLVMSWCTELKELPESFGSLGTLIALDLTGSRIECLPESFGSLDSLETLVLSWCSQLEELPNSFGSLGTLRTLDLKGSGIECLPDSFGKLISLQGNLVVSQHSNPKNLHDSYENLEGLLESFDLMELLSS